MSTEVVAASEFVRLEEHVQARVGRRVCDFRVVVQGRGIVLRGRAPSYYTKQLAQHEVMRVSDLLILANEITVVPQPLTPDEPDGPGDPPRPCTPAPRNCHT
jgi:hypothetical protein